MLRPFFPEFVMSTDLLSLEHPSVLLFCLTTPVGWLLLLQLTALSRSAIVVQSKFLLAFFMLSRCLLDFSVGVGAFVIGLSQISSLFSQPTADCYMYSDLWMYLYYCDTATCEHITSNNNVGRLKSFSNTATWSQETTFYRSLKMKWKWPDRDSSLKHLLQAKEYAWHLSIKCSCKLFNFCFTSTTFFPRLFRLFASTHFSVLLIVSAAIYLVFYALS